ncbi:SCO3242 family prenyltransferase [Streptomyces sp. H27-C3]|uniref:SCO3242 family prenyltransferase n=1 Tax=Streptomyces sp. H27-C3 TaxID=3046305 RepID=UPI0024B9B3F3|nr:UbiA family prenyltransferase [Streptomyces sp. H27-C3]MDJ0462744.1 UbiA family prenyltransferase [Streptomyces sp. H27-C3]
MTPASTGGIGLGAWAELLRVSALFTVPGDALAGAASLGVRPHRGTALAVGASLCLYEAGMALNDWADRDEDAVDRPHRPLPSGRITPGAALLAATALTAAGLTCAAVAGRPALTVAGALAATIWAYDLRLKHTPAASATMATARALDLLLGATATATGTVGAGTGAVPRTAWRSRPAGDRLPWSWRPTPGGDRLPWSWGPRAGAGGSGVRDALPAAAMLGAHTYAVTAVSRREAHGGSTAVPLAALATAALLAGVAGRTPPGQPHRPIVSAAADSGSEGDSGSGLRRAIRIATHLATPAAVAAVAYFRTAATPLLHAALNPSPPLTQRAVGGGIRAMIPLQAALAARGGAVGTGVALIGLLPIARKLSRRVSPT